MKVAALKMLNSGVGDDSALLGLPLLAGSQRERQLVCVPIDDCLPSALEVRPAASPGHGSADAGYTPYVRRSMDSRLRLCLERAVEGFSGGVMLVGDRGTGKTRAWWEALQQTSVPGRKPLQGWSLWPRVGPSDPQTLLRDMPHLGSHTAVVLNDAGRYFVPPVGDEVALELRALLHDTARAPVLLLGTLLTDEWRMLALHDRWRVQALLVGSDIPVPRSFSSTDLAAARMSSDVRLREAAANARHGAVIQYLASAPELRSVVATADEPCSSVVRCLLDLRQLGYTSPVTVGLVKALTPHSADAIHDAIDELARPGAFGLGVVVCDGPSRIRLDDAVLPLPGDFGLALRHPDALWRALADHAGADELIPLAQQAQRRQLFEAAARLYVAASRKRVPDALVLLGDMLRDAGRPDEALECYQRAAEGGHTQAVSSACRMLSAHNRAQAAIDFLHQYSRRDEADAVVQSAVIHADVGRTDVAIREYRRAAEMGDTKAMAVATSMMIESDRHDEAVHWLQRLKERGYADAATVGVAELIDAGLPDAAEAWVERHLLDGDHASLVTTADHLLAVGKTEDALVWFRCAIDAGIVDAYAPAVDALLSVGLHEEAKAWAIRACENGDGEPLVRVGDAFGDKGLLVQALACYDEVARAGHTAGFAAAVLLNARSGRADEARGWRTRALNQGHDVSLVVAVVALADAGEPAAAVDWYLRDADASNPDGVSPLASHLAADDRLAETTVAWHQQVTCGDRAIALRWLARLFEREDKLEAAGSWFLQAGEAGDPTGLLDAGRVHLELKWPQRAVHDLEMALNAGVTESLPRLALAHADLREVTSAITYLRRAGDIGDFRTIAETVQRIIQSRTVSGELEPTLTTELLSVLNPAIQSGCAEAVVAKA